MTIVSSVIASDSAQRDGRRWIEEIHTDQLGLKYIRLYLVDAGYDANAALAAYVAVLEDGIAAAEIQNNLEQVTTLGSLASPKFIYSSAAANVAALRATFQFATQTQAIMIADFLNTLTDQQLQNAFGLTAGQVSNLRTNKLTAAATLAASIRAATGA